MRTLTKEMQENLSPAQTIQLLQEGNRRFVSNLKVNRNLLQQVNETCDGQHPFACILSCIDSRTSAELIFDQGLGDIFSCRIAGNVLNDDVIGSMEFACKVAGAKLIVVLGHSRCGAIKGACDGIELGKLTSLLNKIMPAMDAEVTVTENRNASNPEFVEKVSNLNVRLALRQIPEQSAILSEMVQKGRIALIGGMYDVESGEVKFFENDMITAENFAQFVGIAEA